MPLLWQLDGGWCRTSIRNSREFWLGSGQDWPQVLMIRFECSCPVPFHRLGFRKWRGRVSKFMSLWWITSCRPVAPKRRGLADHTRACMLQSVLERIAALQLLLLVSGLGSVAPAQVGILPKGESEARTAEERSLPRPSAAASYRGDALVYEVVNGLAVYGGHVILGPVEQFAGKNRARVSRNAASSGWPARRDLAPVVAGWLWPDGTIPYQIHPGFDQNGRQEIEEAIDEWNSKTVVTLVQRTSEPDFVHFVPWLEIHACSSVLGRSGGEQLIALGDPGGCGVSSTIHEIGHAVGLRHEHQRMDRDDYVTVSKAKLEGLGGKSSFAFRGSYHAAAPAAGPYDYASVMNYDVGTIPPGIPVRESGRLSPGDIDGVARMYGRSPTATTVSTNPPGLEVIVDGERVTAPASFDWSPGTTHSVRAPLSQTGARRRFVFARWNDGSNRERMVTAGPDSTWFEANYIAQRKVIACTVPEDAGQVAVRPESHDGFYTVGTPVEFEAIPDSGHTHEFMVWGGDFRGKWQGRSTNPLRGSIHPWGEHWLQQRAVFSSGPVFRIEASVAGTEIRVNGDTRVLPWAFSAEEHRTGITVEAPERFPEGTDWAADRVRFGGWSDGGSRFHNVDVPSTGGTLRLDLTREYLLHACGRYGSYETRCIGRDPAASLMVTPQWEDGFYASGTQVQVVAVPPREGLHFAGWTGVASHSNMSATFLMDGPRNVEAVFTESEPLRPGAPKEVAIHSNVPFKLFTREEGYSVLVPPEATELEVSFRSSTVGAEVDLYVSSGLAPFEDWSAEGSYGAVADYESVSPGASERIVIHRRSTPPLRNDVYYIGLGFAGQVGTVRGTLEVQIRRDGLFRVHASPQALAFVSESGTELATQVVQLEHEGIGPARYRIHSDQNWVTANPRELVWPESGTTEISVSATSAGLAPGTYEGRLTILPADGPDPRQAATSSHRSVPVFLAVIPASSGNVEVPEKHRVLIISEPRIGDTYIAGEEIELKVLLGAPREIVGVPSLELSMGDQTRQADFIGAGSGFCTISTLYFRYVVRPEDIAPDGIGIAANALALSGGTFGLFGAVGTNVDHKVNGSAVHVPQVRQLYLIGSPSDGAYNAGEVIEVGVSFTLPIKVTGTPQLALQVGSRTRQASFRRLISAYGDDGFATLLFRYTVQAEDRDADGISIATDALALNGGTISSKGDIAAVLDLGAHARDDDPWHKVNGAIVAQSPRLQRVDFEGGPPNGIAYRAGEQIEVTVSFSGQLKVTGTPQLALQVGSRMRQALFYESYKLTREDGTSEYVLSFRYTVKVDDQDADGISIPANALVLNGGTITDKADVAVTLDLGALAVDDDPLQKVGANIAPEVLRLYIGSREFEDEPHGAGQTIFVYVDFQGHLGVIGKPQLALQVGSRTRIATFSSFTHHYGGSVPPITSISFSYVVQAEDRDADGISIVRNALSLNGGTITSVDGVAAEIDLGAHAIHNSPMHKVDGSICHSGYRC